MWRRRFLAGGLGAAALLLLGRRLLPVAVQANQEELAIIIRDFAFSPSAVTVRPGATVVWTNRDGEPHTVVAVDRAFKSAALDTSDSFRHRFDEPGRYSYVCSLHPHMTGTITVAG